MITIRTILSNQSQYLVLLSVAMLENVQALMQSFSITGNFYVDGLIATTVFGMMKGWLDVLLSMIKNILDFIWIRIRYFFMKRISAKLGGTELYKVSYLPPCEVYYFIKKYVLTQKGDHMDNEFKRLYIKKFFEPHYWYYFDKDESVLGALEVDYLGTRTILSKDEKKTCKADKVYFKYCHKGCYYVFSFYEIDAEFYKSYQEYYMGERVSNDKKESDASRKNGEATIWMEMASFSENTPTKKERTEITEAFLNERFEMNKHIYRTYNIALTDAVNSAIYNAVGQRYIPRENSMATTLVDRKVIQKYMNGVEIHRSENPNPDAISSSTTLIFDVKQLHSGFNYENQLSLANRSSQKSTDIVSSIVYRYITERYSFGGRDFLATHDNFIIFYEPGTGLGARIYVVTQGHKLSEKDAKSIIQRLIDISFKANVNEPEVQLKSQVRVYKRENNNWESYVLSKRSFDSIYLPAKLMGHIRNEFDGFIEIEKLYQQYQIPYKKGILFYGPPGTGKTSLVKALAFEYQLPLYIIDVNDEEINDESIVSILNGLGNSGLKILLFEDIDTAFADKEKVKNETKLLMQEQQIQTEQQQRAGNSSSKPSGNGSGNGNSANQSQSDKMSEPPMTVNVKTNQIRKKFLTYSGLLNALDGVMSNQSGVITIMTTNYIDRLGPAFLRPGRIDVKFKLSECNSEQITEMTKTFLLKRMGMQGKIFADDEPLKYSENDLNEKIETFVKRLVDADGKSKIKPCALQFYLLRYIRHVEDIFTKYDELLEDKIFTIEQE